MADIGLSVQLEGAEEVSRGLQQIQQSAEQLGTHAKESAKSISEPLEGLQQKITGQLEPMKKAASEWAGSFAAVASEVATLGTSLAALGSMLAVKWAADGLEAAKKMQVLADRTGTTAQQMAALTLAANDADIPLNKLVQTMGTLQGRLQAAAEKGKGATFDAVHQLGLDIDALVKMDPTAQLGAIGDALAKITDKNDQLATLQQLLGGRANSLMAFFLQGSEGIRKATQDLKDFNVSYSPETVRDAKAFSDAVNRLGLAFAGLKLQLAAGLGKDLVQIAEAFGNMQRNSEGISTLAAVLEKLGKAVTIGLKGALTVINAFATACADITTAIGAVIAITAQLGSAFNSLLKLDFNSFKAGIKDTFGIIGDVLDKFSKNAAGFEQWLKRLWGGGSAQKSAYFGGGQMMPAVYRTGGPPRGGEYTERESESYYNGEVNFLREQVPDRDDWNELLNDVNSFARSFSREIATMLTENQLNFESFFKSISKMISEIIINATIARPLERGVQGLLGNIIGSLFPGEGGVGSSEGVMLEGATYETAGGGIIPAGFRGLVGESGPEYIQPVSYDRLVTPNKRLGGGNTFNFTFAAGVTRADLVPILSRVKADTVAAVVDLQRRGAF